MTNKEKKSVESAMHSVPMTIIFKLKRQINLLIILVMILTIGLMVSFYDSIKIRDSYWGRHSQDVIEAIHEHCEAPGWHG